MKKKLFVLFTFFCLILNVNAKSFKDGNLNIFENSLACSSIKLLEGEHKPSEDPYPGAGPNLNTNADVSCKKIFKKNNSDEFNDLGQFLQDLFLGIRILAPAMVIILSTIDYIKAIAASSQDDIKKTNQRTIKRMITGVIVFFVPLLLDILFNLFGVYDISTCGIGS